MSARPNHQSIAWAPSSSPAVLTLASGTWLQGSPVTWPDLMDEIGRRIQRLIDRCADPQSAAEQLHESLYQAGLWPDLGQIPTEEAGERLITSNPGVWQRLGQHGVTLQDPKHPPTATSEIPAARSILQVDRENPEAALDNWLNRIVSAP
jgi:hypothetical protein